MNQPTTITLESHFDLPEHIMAKIKSRMKRLVLRKRDIIVRQGNPFTDLCFINKGLLKGYTTDSTNTEQVVSFMREGYWMTDIYSFITGEGSLTTIEALEDCEMLCISRNDLEELYEQNQLIETHFRKLLEKRTARLIQERYILISMDAKERYIDFINNNPELVQRLLQKDIASHLGIFPESLSRIRKSLASRKKGV